jgi:iron complex outermembrane recepter protein
MNLNSRFSLAWVAAGLLVCNSVWPAQEVKPAMANPKQLAEMPLEQLMDLEVTSVTRSPRKISVSPTAIYVITQEDIRRSGATTIAEALRMAPGINVARIDASKWAISARGFNDFFANKLLVLQDGRSIYTPLFSGVFWDVQDTLMEDIERIEVIRGPGATLWGANAVNGVINIITKNAADTQGGLLTGGSGNEERGFGSTRYGGKLGEHAFYRAYVKYFSRDAFVDAQGAEAHDDWDILRGGFRTDWKISATDSLTWQGDYYTGNVGQRFPVFPPPTFFRIVQGHGSVSGGNLLGSWKHVFSETSDMVLQVYHDRTEREDRIHHETRDTEDIDFQHRFAVGERQEVTWGLGYRYSADRLSDGKDETGAVVFWPNHRGDQLFSGFLQDEVILVPDLLQLTLGSKIELNDYTGWEMQPSARLLWTPDEKHTVWAAASRAVRSPARFEHTVRSWFVPPPAQLVANDDFESENLLAYELGYRLQPMTRLSLDFAAFYNVYDDLRLIVPFTSVASPPPFPPLTLYRPENGASGETYGAEFAGTYHITDNWKLSAGYTYLHMNLRRDGNQKGLSPEGAEGDSPRHQFNVRSYLDLPHDLQFDTALYYVDALPNRNVSSYVRLDLRLGWRPSRHLDLSIGAQNLLDDRHPEFGPGFLISPTEIERSVYAKATWTF